MCSQSAESPHKVVVRERKEARAIEEEITNPSGIPEYAHGIPGSVCAVPFKVLPLLSEPRSKALAGPATSAQAGGT